MGSEPAIISCGIIEAARPLSDAVWLLTFRSVRGGEVYNCTVSTEFFVRIYSRCALGDYGHDLLHHGPEYIAQRLIGREVLQYDSTSTSEA